MNRQARSALLDHAVNSSLVLRVVADLSSDTNKYGVDEGHIVQVSEA